MVLQLGEGEGRGGLPQGPHHHPARLPGSPAPSSVLTRGSHAVEGAQVSCTGQPCPGAVGGTGAQRCKQVMGGGAAPAGPGGRPGGATSAPMTSGTPDSWGLVSSPGCAEPPHTHWPQGQVGSHTHISQGRTLGSLLNRRNPCCLLELCPRCQGGYLGFRSKPPTLCSCPGLLAQTTSLHPQLLSPDAAKKQVSAQAQWVGVPPPHLLVTRAQALRL